MAVCAYNSAPLMSDTEIEALRLCKDDFRLSVDPILVASKLSDSHYLGQSFYTEIINMFEQGLDRTRICECLISHLPFCGVTLPNLFTVMNECGYKKLASKLFLSYLKVNGHCPRHVQKSSSGQRPTVHAYFRRLKRMVHDAQLKDPRAFLRELANRFAIKIEKETNEMKRQILADECAAVLGAEIDAIAITFDNNLCNNEVFTQMKSIIPKTSNTLIVDVQYYGRLANANAIIGNFEHGENMLVAARCRAYMAGPCLELVNMLYIEVYVRLWQYENNPAKSTQESLLFWGRIGLESLEEEEVDTKTLWRRMFILRMVFCLLGIGNRANIIPGCTVTEANISEATDLLADIDRHWDGIEARRKMFYYVAKARLSELAKDITRCDIYIRKAAELATEGRFTEIQFIKEYCEDISKRIQCSAVRQPELVAITSIPTRQSRQIRNSPDRQVYTTAIHDPNQPSMRRYDPNQPSVRRYDPNQPSVRTYDPNQPSVRTYDPNQPSVRRYDPNQPSVRRYDPNQPSVRRYDPDQPSVRRYEPDQPSVRRHEPDQPSVRRHEPDQPSVRRHDPDQPSVRRYDPDQPSVRRYDPDQPSVRRYDPDQPSVRRYDPDQPSVRRHEPDQPSVRRHEPDQPSVRRYDPDQPSVRRHEPDQPSVRRYDPDQPSVRRHDPDQPSVRRHEPDQPSVRRHEPDQPSVRRHEPDQPSVRRHEPDQPSVRRYDPDQPSVRRYDPDQPSVRRYDPDHHGHIRNIPSQSGHSSQMGYDPFQPSRIESNIDSDESKNISNNYVILQSNTSSSFRGSMCRQRAGVHPQLSFQGLQSPCSQTENKYYAADIMRTHESTVDTYAQYNELLHEHVPTSVEITRNLPSESHTSSPRDNVIDPNPCDNVMKNFKCSDHDTSSLIQNVEERKHVLTHVEANETPISEVSEGKRAEMQDNVPGESDMIYNFNSIMLFESRGEPSGCSRESVRNVPDIRHHTAETANAVNLPKPKHTKLTLFDNIDTQVNTSREVKYDENPADNDSIKSEDLFGE